MSAIGGISQAVALASLLSAVGCAPVRTAGGNDIGGGGYHVGIDDWAERWTPELPVVLAKGDPDSIARHLLATRYGGMGELSYCYDPRFPDKIFIRDHSARYGRSRGTAPNS